MLHIKIDKQFFEILNGSSIENNTLHTQNSEQVIFENEKEINVDSEQTSTAHQFIFSVLQNMRKIKMLTMKNFVILNAPKSLPSRGYNTIRQLHLQDCNTMMIMVSLGQYIQNVEEISIESHF
jgi:hypothetical protein